MKRLFLFLILSLSVAFSQTQFGVDNLRVNTSLDVAGTNINLAFLEKLQNANYVAALRFGNPQAGITYDNLSETITWSQEIQVRALIDADAHILFSIPANTYDWTAFGSIHLWVCAVKDSTNLIGYSLNSIEIIENDDIYPLFLVMDDQLVWSAFNMNYFASTTLNHLSTGVINYIDDGDAKSPDQIANNSKYPFTDESSLLAGSTMPDSVFREFWIYGDSAYTPADTARWLYVRFVTENHASLKWHISVMESDGAAISQFQTSVDPGQTIQTVKLRPVGNSGIYGQAVIDWGAMSTNYLFGPTTLNARIRPQNILPIQSDVLEVAPITGSSSYDIDVSTEVDTGMTGRIITPDDYDSSRPEPYPVVIYIGTWSDLIVGTGARGGFYDTLNTNGIIMASFEGPDCWGSPRCSQIAKNLYDYIQRNFNAEHSVHCLGVSRGFLQGLNIAEHNWFPVKSVMSFAGVTDVEWGYNYRPEWATSMEEQFDFTGAAAVDSATRGYDPAKRNRFIVGTDTFRIGSVPLHIWHGDTDNTVPYSQSRRFRDWLHKTGSHCILDSLVNVGHGDDALFDGPGVVRFIKTLGINYD